MKKIHMVLIACIVLNGCAMGFIPLSEDTIRNKTALVLGVNSSEISISNVRRDDGAFMGVEFYEAETSKGLYTCKIMKGTGIATPPECEKQE